MKRRVLLASFAILAFTLTSGAQNQGKPNAEEDAAKAPAQRLRSPDKAQASKALDEVRDTLDSKGQPYYGFIGKYWLPALIEAHRYGQAEDLAFDGICVAPGQMAMVESLQEWRVRIALAAGNSEEALACARSFYNVASFLATERALLLMAECLQRAHPDDAGIVDRFRQEQVAGAVVGEDQNQKPKTSPLLTAIRITEKPYEEAMADVRPGVWGMADKINLMLLAGQGAAAQQVCEDLMKMPENNAGDKLFRQECYARTLKAQDGTIGRANGYMQKEAPARVDPKAPALPQAKLPWKRDVATPVPVLVASMDISFDAAKPQRLIAPSITSDRSDEAKFVVALAQDKQGRVWVGTEDEGVWRFDPGAPEGQQWKGFGEREGLGDNNAYAITCDPGGRIWVGHLNHGVSVYAGGLWKNYGVLDGPLGERVYALATSPVDGDVWIATNCGLTRYSYKNDMWSYYTRAQGLPSDQASSLAFDRDGTLYIGTQCDGIAIGKAADSYEKWQVIHARSEYRDRVPLVPKGDGLPTDMINQILVAHDGTVYAATTTGLAKSTDHGQTWTFTRGQDWAEKVKLLQGGPPAGWKETPGADMAEDYLTCLAEDEAGMLYVGTRGKGYEIIDPRSGLHQRQTLPPKPALNPVVPTAYVGALLPRPGLPTLVGRYRYGLTETALQFATPGTHTDHPPLPHDVITFPKAAPAPTLAELNALLAELARVPKVDPAQAPAVVGLAPDWTTQGAWLGRYGRYFMCLCACTSPGDFVWGTGAENVKYYAAIGPHHGVGDSIRYWVHSNHTSNPRSLELPLPYLDSRVRKKLTTWEVDRRQSEWDDHSEAYPFAYEGPNLRCNIAIPAGTFILSLYNMNKDGHGDAQRFRDYPILVREHPSDKPLTDFSDLDRQPDLARVRCRDFWGGAWFRFLVRGPRQLSFQVNRNYSLCTILAGVALDKLDECPEPYFTQADASSPIPADLSFAARPTETEAAEALFQCLARLEKDNPAWQHTEGRRFYQRLAQWYELNAPKLTADQGQFAQRRLATCFYQLRLFEKWEQIQQHLGFLTARQMERGLRWDGRANGYPTYCRDLLTAYRISHIKEDMRQTR